MRRRAAFTLVEVLLVVMIILIASAIAVPSFVHSYRGAKLRASARAISMIHRHARSMAVLGQQHLAVLFDKVKNELEVVMLSGGAGDAGAQSMFLEERSQRTGVEDPAAAAEGGGTVASKMIRRLEEGVLIERVDIETPGDNEIDGIYWVNYYPNGMCDPYELVLRDDRGQGLEIKVDHISGKVAMKNE